MGTAFEFKPNILGFLCNWCCYAGADLAGVSRCQYPPTMKVVRVMCSGRVDAEHVIRAFSAGVDGVFIGGCWLGECHYATEGNYDALSMMHLCRESMRKVGINPERLRLEWVSASEGAKWRDVVNEATEKARALGPFEAYRALGNGVAAADDIDRREPKSHDSSLSAADGRVGWSDRLEPETEDFFRSSQHLC